MRAAVVMAAFLRACARARLLRTLLLSQPADQQELFLSHAGGAHSRIRGCSVLNEVYLRGAAIGFGGMNVIDCVRHVTWTPFKDHANPLFAQAIPHDFHVGMTLCHVYPSRSASVSDLQEAFKIAATICGEAPAPLDCGSAIGRALSDPSVRKLMNATPQQGDINAFLTHLTTTNNLAVPDGTPSFFSNPEEFAMRLLGAAPFRSAAFGLLTAARVLGCRVRQGDMISQHKGKSQPRCGWLSLPSEIRRACIEFLPTFYVLSAAELHARFSLPGPAEEYINFRQPEARSPLSHALIARILAYATDRRTIGYGSLPEATFLELRLTAEAAQQAADSDASPRLFDEPRWSFAAASRRWKPVDSRSLSDARRMLEEAVDYPWEAECFLRATGFKDDLAGIFATVPAMMAALPAMM